MLKWFAQKWSLNTKCNTESLTVTIPVEVIQHRILRYASTWVLWCLAIQSVVSGPVTVGLTWEPTGMQSLRQQDPQMLHVHNYSYNCCCKSVNSTQWSSPRPLERDSLYLRPLLFGALQTTLYSIPITRPLLDVLATFPSGNSPLEALPLSSRKCSLAEEIWFCPLPPTLVFPLGPERTSMILLWQTSLYWRSNHTPSAFSFQHDVVWAFSLSWTLFSQKASSFRKRLD